jgi:hypothetical protein
VNGTRRMLFRTAAIVLTLTAPLAHAQNTRIDGAIAAPMQALDRALAADALLPPATTDTERLERMGAIDQSWRYHMGELKLEGLSEDEIKGAYAAITARTTPIDRHHRDEVLRMLPKQGWFSITAYGPKAAEAAFHIINHADIDAQLRVLPALERMAMQSEADPSDFATMYDKLQMKLDRPQRYGTQFACVDHRRVLYRLEDPARVEERRKPMKFRITLADQLRRIAERGARC